MSPILLGSRPPVLTWGEGLPTFIAVLSSDQAARAGALCVFRDDLETLVVTGPDRLEWLEAILTCDVAGIGNDARWSLALTKPGKILGDLFLVETGSRTYLGVPASARDRLLGFLAGFLVMEDADIAFAPDFAWLTVHGPLAADVGAGVASAASGHSAPLALTGLGDAAVVYPREMDAFARRAAASDVRATVATPEDWERLRVERQVPLFGKDFFESTSPHEASLERRCISWEKGCYLGQEAVCMQEMRGKVKRRTALLRLDAGPVPAAGTPVADASGAPAGETRSAVASAVHGAPLALAVLSASLAVPGVTVRVGEHRATVVEPNR